MAMRAMTVQNPWQTPGYNPNPPGTPADAGGGSVPVPDALGGAGGPPPTPTPVGGAPPLRRGPAAPTSKPADANPVTVSASSPANPGLTEPPAPTVLPDGQGGSVPVPPAPMAPWNQDTFTADSNVINSQVNPGADPRQLKLQGYQDTALDKMFNGPDRNAMARDQYNTWEAETAPSFEHDITDATDAAAAHGQIRSGQLTNRYGDLARQRVLDKTTARNRYMQNALDSSINDTRANFGAASDAGAQAFGQGVEQRGEQRQERGYQRSLAEQAIARRIAQQQAESGQEQQQFGNSVTQYELGNAADPTAALGDAAGLAGAEAGQSSSDMAALIRAWLARQQQPAAAA